MELRTDKEFQTVAQIEIFPIRAVVLSVIELRLFVAKGDRQIEHIVFPADQPQGIRIPRILFCFAEGMLAAEHKTLLQLPGGDAPVRNRKMFQTGNFQLRKFDVPFHSLSDFCHADGKSPDGGGPVACLLSPEDPHGCLIHADGV